MKPVDMPENQEWVVGYSRKNAEFPVILNRRSKVYIVNPTVDTGSSVERLSFGSVSFVVPLPSRLGFGLSQ